MELNYNDLPKTENFEEEGIYILEITDIAQKVTTNGHTTFEFSYNIVGKDLEINYDNCILMNSDGSRNKFGPKKLRAIIDALKLEVTNINIDIMKELAVGGRLKAKVVKGNRGYPETSFSDFYPLDSNMEALNEEAKNK